MKLDHTQDGILIHCKCDVMPIPFDCLVDDGLMNISTFACPSDENIGYSEKTVDRKGKKVVYKYQLWQI